MIDITKLYCGERTSGDDLRYSGNADARRPIVVWNCTRTCNLKCRHCYSDSAAERYPGELTTEEARKMIQNLTEFKVPALLFSGGEPLLRPDLFELIEFAVRQGMRTVISTNGTLITRELAWRIKTAGVSYVGISLDGTGKINDLFRGVAGAFSAALKGFRRCVEIGQKVGLRLTLTRDNYQELDRIFDLIQEEGINRACFYHLVYSGRGSSMQKDDLTHAETRQALDLIMERTKGLKDKNILTVDNHADGVYIYRRLKQQHPGMAERAYRWLKINGGNRSGIGLAAIDNLGNVHADQFWENYSFGNVLQRKFSDIWMDTSDPLMAGLKDRKKLLKGKCRRCCYLDLCNGNFRLRAQAVFADPWAEDPACYLTEEEVAS